MPIWQWVWGLKMLLEYFSVSASELTLDQSTVLPVCSRDEIYNPLYSVENAANHHNTVHLKNMVAAGLYRPSYSRSIPPQSTFMDNWWMPMKASQKIIATPSISMRLSTRLSMNGLTEEDIASEAATSLYRDGPEYQASMVIL